jgi:hypothetical protein
VGGNHCLRHPDERARFQCPKCGPLCERCTEHKWIGGGFVDECLSCQQRVTELSNRGAPRVTSEDRTPAGYLRRIPEFLQFPINRSALYMLIGLTIITAPLYWAIINNISGVLALFGLLFVKSLEASVYFRFVFKTAYGETEIDPPDAEDLVDDLFGPLLRYLAALLPIIAAIVLWGQDLGSIQAAFFLFAIKPSLLFDAGGLPAILLVTGLALLPLLTVVAAVSGSVVSVLNPAIWVQSIRILGATYVVASVCFYAVLLAEFLLWLPLLIDLKLAVDIPVLSTLVVLFLGYLPMALRARVLGGMVEPFLADLE